MRLTENNSKKNGYLKWLTAKWYKNGTNCFKNKKLEEQTGALKEKAKENQARKLVPKKMSYL